MKTTQNIYNKLFSKQAPQRTASTRQVKFALIDEIDSHIANAFDTLEEGTGAFGVNEKAMDIIMGQLSNMIDTYDIADRIKEHVRRNEELMTKLEDALSALGLQKMDSPQAWRLEEINVKLAEILNNIESQQSGPYADLVNLM